MSNTAFFKMSDELLECPCALDLSQRHNGDGDAGARMYLFIRLLCYALYPGKSFANAAALARFSGASPKQAARVWDACIRHGVLRESGNGYSARSWLIESGYLGRAAAPKKPKDGGAGYDSKRSSPDRRGNRGSWSFAGYVEGGYGF